MRKIVNIKSLSRNFYARKIASLRGIYVMRYMRLRIVCQSATSSFRRFRFCSLSLSLQRIPHNQIATSRSRRICNKLPRLIHRKSLCLRQNRNALLGAHLLHANTLRICSITQRRWLIYLAHVNHRNHACSSQHRSTRWRLRS
ncbi:Uncharacterised protein [Chlamydia trachomatis]|nr:Uncharacterised protein [Chlamydia trachomatis]